jgi:hypothetical protein
VIILKMSYREISDRFYKFTTAKTMQALNPGSRPCIVHCRIGGADYALLIALESAMYTTLFNVLNDKGKKREEKGRRGILNLFIFKYLQHRVLQSHNLNRK